MAVGVAHVCAVTAAGAVLCWGANGSGELGDGTQQDRLTPTPVSGASSGFARVFAGNGRTCATRADGHTLCWGAPLVGDGTVQPRLTPTPLAGY